jgi:predicted Zn-dependent peptidase
MLAFGAVAKETPPPAAPPRPIQIPASETITLENGLSATFIPFGQVPKVTIEAVVRTGELNAAGKPWLANIAGDLLHLGTANRSAEQISTDAASMGGDVSVGVGDDQSFVGIDVLSEDAPRAVALIGEVLTTPQLPESELARIRQDYLRNLSVERTQPQTLADEAFAGILYPQHPYGATLPTEEQLHAYTIADVKRYYDDNFGAVRTHIYVAGKFDRAAIEAAIRQAFGKWKAGAQPLVLPAKRGPAAVKFIDRPGAPQSTIRIGVRVLPPTDPEFMPLSVANTVLGGALTSRITLNIREQKGWAYSPSSTIEPKYHDAIWYEEADVKTEATAGAIREIFKEIDRLRSEPPSTSELESMKSYRNGGFVLSTATREGLMAQLAYMNLQELPASWLSTYVARLYAVTPAQVSESTRSQLDPKAMSVVVVGDLSKIRADVEQALREKHD